MSEKSYPKKYQEWIRGLFHCDRKECPYHKEFEAMKEEGVYPRGMAGCVKNPRIVVIGLQPGAAFHLETLLYKRAKCELDVEPWKIVDFVDYLYFGGNRNLHKRTSFYVESLRDLFEKLSGEDGGGKDLIYHTNLMKCQKERPEETREPDPKSKYSCYEHFKKEMKAVLCSDPKRAVYVLLGGPVRDFFEKMKSKDDDLAKIIWDRRIEARHPGQPRWNNDLITSLAQEIKKKLSSG